MAAKVKYKTREEWLNVGMLLLKPEFETRGHDVPKKIRVSCGFPSRNALGNRKQSIGECWADKVSKGNYFEIFVSPVLSEPVKVLDVLIHEMVHAVVGLEAGHKAPFKKVAVAIGLEGKMTATYAGEELKKRLQAVARDLGGYPHDELSKMTNAKKPDRCRLIKASCPNCGYVIRTTRKWIDEAGLPTCVCGEEFTEGEE